MAGSVLGRDERRPAAAPWWRLRHEADRGRKIGVYAASGIAEVWMIDARRLVTSVFRALGAEGYRDIVEVGPGGDLTSVRRPEIRLDLVKLGLSPQAVA